MTNHEIIQLSSDNPTKLTEGQLHSGMDITIQNINDYGYVYIGSDSVTTLDFGYRIAAGHAISFELPGKDTLYAVSSDADMSIAVIRIGLEAQE